MDRKERNVTPRPCSNDIILVDRDSLRKMLPFFYVFKSKIRIVRMISDEFVRNRKDDFG